MDIHLFYLEQYKMLREEIMFSMGQIYSTEAYGAIAVLGMYAWLLVNTSRISTRPIWFVPPCLIFACSIHCLMLALRLSMIGEYLKGVEEAILGLETKVPGWEGYKFSHQGVEKIDFILASVAWVVALCGSIGVSWWGSRAYAPGLDNASPN